jgi:hypothetical protein
MVGEVVSHYRILGKKFQGDEAVQAGVFGLVDNAHATAA